MRRKQLQGLRVAALAADGFEQIELTSPLKTLKRHGANVEVVSLRPGSIRGMNLLIPGKQIDVDRRVRDADPAMYDALLLPGGFINPDLLRQSEDVLAFVRAFDAASKPIAVICHGPWVLASAGLVSDRRLTSWPGIKDDLINAGATWKNRAIVRDQNWVSSRGPHDLRAFTKAMVALFAERAALVPQEEQAQQGVALGRWIRRAVLATAVGYALRRLASSGAAEPVRRQVATLLGAAR
jgi:protease I